MATRSILSPKFMPVTLLSIKHFADRHFQVTSDDPAPVSRILGPVPASNLAPGIYILHLEVTPIGVTEGVEQAQARSIIGR